MPLPLFTCVAYRARSGVRAPRRRRRLRGAPWTLLFVVGCGRIGYDLTPLRDDAGLAVESGARASFDDASPASNGGAGASGGAPASTGGGSNGGAATDGMGGGPITAGTTGAGGASESGGAGESGGTSGAGGASGGPGSGGNIGAGGSSCSPACTNSHGTTSCVTTKCTPVCAAGFDDCDGKPANGCETNTDADPVNCGTCAKVCSGATGTPVCNAGICGVSSCSAGLGDCDGKKANGCETNLETSPSDCGFCSNACTNAHGTTACGSGVCNPTCSGGFDDCDGDPKNGCEASTSTPSNCGSCGNVCDAALPLCNGGACSCDLSGTWATKLTVNVTWPGTFAITGGSGVVQLWGLLGGNQSGNSIPATLLPCGLTLPDYSSSAASGGEPYGFTFPTTLFDHSPSYLNAAGDTVALSGSVPGSSYSAPSFVNLIGLTMTNGATDPWPASYTGVTTVDADSDTKPGVTGNLKTGGSYLYTPVDAGKSSRADRLYISLRAVASLSGTVGSCTQLSGTASLLRFDYHLVGCRVSGGGDCNSTQASFVDGSRVGFTPGSGTFTAKKLGGAPTCAAVRAAIP